MRVLRTFLLAQLIVSLPAHSRCFLKLISWKSTKQTDAVVDSGTRGKYRSYVQNWETTFSHLRLENPAQKINQAPEMNTRKNRIYAATVNGENLIFKNYEAGVPRDPVHEMAMYKMCEDLGIKTVGIRGYSYIDGSLSFATNFVDGSLLAIRYGPVFGNTNTTVTPGKINPSTWPKIESIGEKLKAAGIEARDLQFIITPEGEPYLMDVGDFYISHSTDEKDSTSPREGWTEHYLSIYRKAFDQLAKKNGF